MANPRSAWGIDIGNRALKAVKLVRDADSGALRVADFELIEHDTPLSNAGDNRDSLISAALANFIQKHPDRKGVAGVSVSGSSSLARFIKLPPVEKRKLPDIVRFEAIQQIPFPLEDVEWSYQLFEDPDSPEVEVGIFAMRKELINHHLKFFTDVGLNVEVVQLNPLAIYNAMQYDQRIDGATMIIDLGSENTDLIIADGRSIWLRSIPVGGKSFTEVLVKQFKLPFAKAEELKRTAATSKYAKQIFQAMRPVFADLVAEVQRSIGFYASVHRDSRLKKVLALGGTFRLPGLQKYLQQNLQLEVQRIDRLEAGAPADAKQRAAFDENLLSMATAYGLAIQAMGDGQINSSLLPATIRREKMWKDKKPIFAAAAAAFMLGAGVAMGSYFLQNLQYQGHQSDRDQIQAVINTGKSLDTDWDSNVEQQGSGDRQRIANVQSMIWYRDLWPGIINDIYSSLPTPKDRVLLSGDWNAIKAKIPNRKDRDILLIDSISSVYDTDLSKVGAPPAGGANPGVAAAGALPGFNPATITPGAHGFQIIMELVTPYGGDPVTALKFVKESFVKKLQGLKDGEIAAKKQYALVYADITSRRSAGQDANYLKMMQDRSNNMQSAASASGLLGGLAGGAGSAYLPPQQSSQAPSGGGSFGFGGNMDIDAVPGRPGGGFGAPAAASLQAAAGVHPANADPSTGEDVSNDTLVEVTALVVVSPNNQPPVLPPPPPPAPPAN